MKMLNVPKLSLYLLNEEGLFFQTLLSVERATGGTLTDRHAEAFHPAPTFALYFLLS